MITTRAKKFPYPLQTIVGLFIALTVCVYTACSNSELVGSNGNDDIAIDYLPLDDTEYPYAGIPRIVIETENHRAIKDRETEIPAKLQIWGEKNPESEIMALTIKGRGNTSWDNKPKKSYKIEFANKQAMLGMPKDRDWALIANYTDKTLMKNYLMYQLSAKIGAYYAPRCEFAELYINNKYLGVYLLSETIKRARNRINMPKSNDSYIIEFDAKYRDDEQIFFSKVICKDSIGKPYHVHEPKGATKATLSTIETHIINFESFLKTIDPKIDNHLEKWIDLSEYIRHYWVQELSKNPDADFYSSVFFSWKQDGVIKMGPVWDFDLAFGCHIGESRNSPEGWYIKKGFWNNYVFKDSTSEHFREHFWRTNRNTFLSTLNTIDSLSEFLQYAASNNFRKWNVLQNTKPAYYPRAFETHADAAKDLKEWLSKRIEWIDSQINQNDSDKSSK